MTSDITNGDDEIIDDVSGDPELSPEPRRPQRALLDIGEPRVPIITSTFVIAALMMTAWEFIRWGLSPTAAELSRAGGWGLGAFANGSWSKAITANLLHGGLIHLAMNIFVIYLVGRWLEYVIGRTATLAVITTGILLSSVGSLVLDGAPVTIGASGVAFALVGAGIVADPHRRTILGSISIQLGVLNFVLTFLVPGISKGGHLGGLVAGVLVGLVVWRGNRALPKAGAEAEVAADSNSPIHPASGAATGATPLGVARSTPATLIAVVGAVLIVYLLVAPAAPPSGLKDSYRAAATSLVARSLNSNTFGTESESFKPSKASCTATQVRGAYQCDFVVNDNKLTDQYVVFDHTDQMRILGAGQSPPE